MLRAIHKKSIGSLPARDIPWCPKEQKERMLTEVGSILLLVNVATCELLGNVLEPTQIALLAPEASALDRSAILPERYGLYLMYD